MVESNRQCVGDACVKSCLLGSVEAEPGCLRHVRLEASENETDFRMLSPEPALQVTPVQSVPAPAVPAVQAVPVH